MKNVGDFDALCKKWDFSSKDIIIRTIINQKTFVFVIQVI